MLAVLWPEMLAIAAVRKYPFLDLRTSTFLFVVTAVVAAVGRLAGVCSLLRPWLKGGIAIAVAAVAVAGFALAVKPYVRSHLIPNEDVRDQARYVATHAAPSDVILVNLNSNWGFAYYWPVGHPSRRRRGIPVVRGLFPPASRALLWRATATPRESRWRWRRRWPGRGNGPAPDLADPHARIGGRGACLAGSAAAAAADRRPGRRRGSERRTGGQVPVPMSLGCRPLGGPAASGPEPRARSRCSGTPAAAPGTERFPIG